MAEIGTPEPGATGEQNRVIDLAHCPPIFVLPTRLGLEELHNVEEKLTKCSATLTYDISEASWVLGKIAQKKRATLELRSRGIWTKEVPEPQFEPQPKRRRLHTPPGRVEAVKQAEVVDLTMQSDTETDWDVSDATNESTKMVLKPPETQPKRLHSPPDDRENIRVIKLDWLYDSLKASREFPLEPYTVYYARKVSRQQTPSLGASTSAVSSLVAEEGSPRSPAREQKSESTSAIIERAKADATASPAPRPVPYFTRSRRDKDGHRSTPAHRPPPKLYRRTTSENDDPSHLPPPPDWVKKNLIYACQRPSPLHSPNEAFIAQLLKIKRVRELTLDEIGVRAYSTSIAAIAAYPYPLRSPEEVLSLPGCESRIANLFAEWKDSENGTVEAAGQLDADPVLPVLNLFYNIWGVGAKTARDFYYHKQWRSLDDIVEQGWDSLSRVQQIGLKYYDEFLDGIPRAHVEKIGSVILEHAKKVRPGCDYDGKGMECVIVGGYRRGKERSGDVDVILSHRDEKVTLNLVYDIVASLEEEGWITHTLSLHLTNSHRDQQTLPYRGDSGGKPRFDSLDKALVVWQDPYFEAPSFPSKEGSPDDTAADQEQQAQADMEATKKINSNPHRRVDIIISPWRTVGCAVLGWSGDTTFQRDMRRYVKKVHGWKFDSSGVRDRKTGRVIDLEHGGQTWEEREKLVLNNMGIGWRPPEERCTR